jgi:DNA-binding MarR family transcriptional regulator
MDPDEPVGLLIGAVRRRIRQALGSHARRYHLTAQQFWVLVTIYEHPGFSLGELAAHLRMDKPTASRLVFTLAKRKMVQVRDDTADRRLARLHLEAAGTAVGRELVELATAVRSAIVRGFTTAELAALRDALRKIIANMDRFQHNHSLPPAAARRRPARRLIATGQRPGQRARQQ